MKLMICVDDRGGMSFFGRRQSMDRVLRQRALALLNGETLWMSAYTREQFAPHDPGLAVDPGFPAGVPEGSWCFPETTDPTALLEKADTVALFRWNRLYPFDLRFPLEVLDNSWKRTHWEEFAGSSHERITLEVYER